MQMVRDRGMDSMYKCVQVQSRIVTINIVSVDRHDYSSIIVCY